MQCSNRTILFLFANNILNVLLLLIYLFLWGYIKIVNQLSNNMGNRSRTEIVGSILDAANGGATKTKLCT